MEQLTTAKDMYNFCIKNKLGSGFNETWGLKHFGLIEQNLMEGEYVLMTFIGLHNYVSATHHDNNFAYAITNKRILMAQKRLIGEVVQAVSLDNINDITLVKKMVFGIITIDTIKEKFNIAVASNIADNINSQIHKILDNINKNSSIQSSDIDSFDKIKKLKELLDMGAISQEEYEAKKKQLLEIN